MSRAGMKDSMILSAYGSGESILAQKAQNPRMGQDAGSDLCFEVSSRDRIAPDCAIRHSVWPIVALQRRVRFSAPSARFCRIRCHQRRAIRAEHASFSVLVSNLDFRVPRLRPIGERALTGPCGGEERPPESPKSRSGLPRRSWPSTFWSRCGPSLDPGLCPGAWHPVLCQNSVRLK